MRAAVREHVEARVVVRGEDSDRPLQCVQALGIGELVAPVAAVAQGLPEGPEPVDAPFHQGRIVDEGVGAAASGGHEDVRGARPDGHRGIADGDEIGFPRGKRRVVHVHDDRRDVRAREGRDRALRVGDGQDETVETLPQGLGDARVREFVRRAHERAVPVVRIAQVAEDAAEFVLARDSGHAQCDENLLPHGRQYIIPLPDV